MTGVAGEAVVGKEIRRVGKDGVEEFQAVAVVETQ
jgi:hypothetical protein